MGRSFLFQEDFSSKVNMEKYNPNKRIRLDLPNNFERNVPNDDLWGAEDLTAEEFDMLEIQATQSHQQNDTSTAFVQPLALTFVNNVSMHQEDETKQQLYELEGKIKLLTQSLEKVSKELKEEKLKSNKLVSEKSQQSLAKENDLRKEIKKVESALQFKDQEMKSLYQKVHLLETQLQEKKEKSEVPVNQTSNFFLEKFKFNSETSFHKPETCPQNKPQSFRRFKLPADTPKGEVQGTDKISTILCNKLSSSSAQNHCSSIPSIQFSTESQIKQYPQLSAVSILKLSADQQTEELFDYISSVLKNYLSSLKSAKSAVCSTVNSPLSLRRKESNKDKKLVILCLKVLASFISSSQFLSLVQKHKDRDRSSNQMEMDDMSATHQFPACDWKTDEPEQKINLLLQSLVSLSIPESYPVSYLKNDEIQLSLTCLASWSALAPESFFPLNDEILYRSLFCYEDVAPLFLSLKLMTNLCVHKEFIPVLLHKNDSCFLCVISSLTEQKIPQNPLEFITIMLMIENFLSVLFTVHSFIQLRLDSSPCCSMVFQGVIISLCKFYEIYKEGNHEVTPVLKKGFTLVHHLSRYLPNSKERRSSFEDSYIYSVCGMLTLSKENPTFKEFYDIVHDLWDFQEDTSEFDLDDPSEELSQMAEMIS